MRLTPAAFAMLAGCAGAEVDPQGYTWTNDGPSAPVVMHIGADVYLNCGLEEKARSCAIQGRGDGLCHIYLPPDPLPWQEAHERKHCAGWRHPNNLRW